MLRIRKSAFYEIILMLFWGVLMFLTTYSHTTEPGYLIENTLSKWTYVLLFFHLGVLFLISQIIHGKYRFTIPVNLSLLLYLVLMFAMMSISSLFDYYSLRYIAPVVIWNLLIFLNLYLLSGFVHFGKFIHSITNFIIIYSVISILVAIVTYFTDIKMGDYIHIVQFKETPRLNGWYGNPNRLAGVSAAGALCLLYRIISHNINIVLAMAFALILFTGLVLAASKAAVVALAIASVPVFLFSAYKTRMTVLGVHQLTVTTIFLIIVIGLLFPLGIDYFNIYSETIKNELFRVDIISERYDAGRLDIWGEAWTILQSSSFMELLFGHGYGFFISETGRSPHNTYIKFIIEHGVVFFLMFVSFLMNAAVKSINKLSKKGSRESLVYLFILYLIIKDIPGTGMLSFRFEGVLFMFIVVFAARQGGQQLNVSILNNPISKSEKSK